MKELKDFIKKYSGIRSKVSQALFPDLTKHGALNKLKQIEKGNMELPANWKQKLKENGYELS